MALSKEDKAEIGKMIAYAIRDFVHKTYPRPLDKAVDYEVQKMVNHAEADEIEIDDVEAAKAHRALVGEF